MLVEVKTVYELMDIEGNRYGVCVSREAAEKEIKRLESESGINPCSMEIEEIPLLGWRSDKMKATHVRFSEAVQDVSAELSKHGLTAIYIALYGSQNYCIQTLASDIDLKVIVIPTLNDIVSNTKPVSETWNFKWGQADVKDIRLMVENWLKQNTNFLEILYTPYCMIHPDYTDEVYKMIDAREDIARIDTLRHIRATMGMQDQKFHALKHRFPSKVEVIDKYGYDPKQLSHIIRLYDLTSKYVEGKDYLECILPSGELKNTIIDIKIGKLTYTPDEAENMARTYMAATDVLYRSYKDTVSETSDYKDTKGYKALEEFKYSVIKKALKEELKNEDFS